MTIPDTLEERAYLLALVVHELGGPLAAALENLHIMRLLSSDGGIRDRVCARIERQLRHAEALVKDLLEMSRADLGKLNVRRDELELVRLVQDMVEDRRGAILRAGLTITLEVPDMPVWIMGDDLRLRQVLGNLLNNAEKFTLVGGSIAVSISADGLKRQALLRVRDTGEGIDAAMIGRIFDPFVQAERTASRANTGLGLGLALVKRLVELHGGDVKAISEGRGQGAEFLIHLPLIEHVPCREMLFDSAQSE